MFIENMFKVFYEGNFIYDLLWLVNVKFRGDIFIGLMYLYILDYELIQICFIIEELCFQMFYLGLWEILNVNVMNVDYLICGFMMDGCDLLVNVIVWYEIFKRNFYYYYDINWVLFGMQMYVIFFY